MILYLPLFFVITLGLVFGSFIFAMSIRLPAEESVWTRSHCCHCGKKISSLGLVPVLGYLFYGGKCPDCKEKVPVIYPLVEMLNAALAVIIYLKTGWTFEFFHIFLIFQALLLVSMIDFKTCLIFEHPIIFLLLLQVGWLYFFGTQKQVIDSLIGLSAGAGIFHWVSYLYQVVRNRVGLGEGDATLLGVIGFCFGWQVLFSIIFWSALFGVIGAGCFLVINRKALSQKVAFGPWIALASFLIWLYPEFFRAFPFAI